MSKLVLYVVAALGAAVPVMAATSGRLSTPDIEPGRREWPLIAGGSGVWQYSPLRQINKKTIKHLGLAWYSDLATTAGLVGNPLVADGVVYQSGPMGQVFATDAATGKERWTFTEPMRYRPDMSFISFWATHTNRGLAIDSDHVYVGTGDCRLLAIARKTGLLVWEAQSCDPKLDLGIVGAPRVGGGKVFIGNTNGEQGTARPFVNAFDARTGKQIWRFYTIPGDPAAGFENPAMEMAAKTWGTDYTKFHIGAVAPWDSMTYDPVLNLLYFGTGNPDPLNPAERAPDAGDELFSDSIVAVNADTGEYVWHFQVTPHDGWDYDATAPIMIAELPINGSPRRVLLTAEKNGFLYVLDARTGQFISGNNYVPTTVFSGLEPHTGRAILQDEAQYWKHPGTEVVLQPGSEGAHSWTATAFDPDSGLVYIPAFILPQRYQYDPQRPGEMQVDREYGTKKVAEIHTLGRLVAWDPISQKERWHADHSIPINGGVLVTGGGIVFQGTADGKFLAYDAGTGEPLWSFDAHEVILGAPSVVEINGQEVIFVPAGDGGATSNGRMSPHLLSSRRTLGPSRLLAFKLGGTGAVPPTPAREVPKPWRSQQPADLALRGAALFDKNACFACHGYNAVNGGLSTPDLRMSGADVYAAMHGIVIDGALLSAGMPAFRHLTDEDLKAIQAYLTNQAWKGYESRKVDQLGSK